MDDMTRLAVDLARSADTIAHRARGAGAKVVDAAAATARSNALSTWTRYGRGERGAAGTIRGRMSRDRSKVRGYLLADGDGAFFQEVGTVNHPPQPAIGDAAEQHSDAWAEAIADAGGDLL
jgi:hypothetical protein